VSKITGTSVAKDRHSALVQFEIKGEGGRRRSTRSIPSSAAVEKAATRP